MIDWPADRPTDRPGRAIDQPRRRRRRNIIQLLNGLAAVEEPLLRYFAFVVRARMLARQPIRVPLPGFGGIKVGTLHNSA